jgi:nicotinamide mononucleotide (NMN) deamidase PncC
VPGVDTGMLNLSSALEILLAKKVRLAIATTGAGAGLQEDLWRIPGISEVLARSSFPYGTDDLAEYLGFVPDTSPATGKPSYCSPEVALDMAMAAYYRAYKFGAAPAIGVGLTASVASNREHRGDHRAYVAYFTDSDSRVISAKLKKGVGAEQRKLDGELCDALGARAILAAVGGEESFALPYLVETYAEHDAWGLANDRLLKRPFFRSDGTRSEKLPDALGTPLTALFAGAFNPPHPGHLGMADAYASRGPVVFTTDLGAPHKSPLNAADALQRARMLKGRNLIFTSDAGRYLDKARLYPGMPFVMGTDALVRMLDPKWGLSPRDLVDGFDETHTEFYVADRELDGKLVRLEDVPNPGLKLHRLQGRWNISSSELRTAAGV